MCVPNGSKPRKNAEPSAELKESSPVNRLTPKHSREKKNASCDVKRKPDSSAALNVGATACAVYFPNPSLSLR